MRIVGATVVAALFIANTVMAQQWVGDVRLVTERSTGNCNASLGTQTYEIVGNTLKRLDKGSEYSTAIGTDGNVRHDQYSRVGLKLTLTGNARTRDLIVTNPNGCTWRVVPLQ